MSACPTCGYEPPGKHDHTWYRIEHPVVYEEDENVHACEPMMSLNRIRDLQGRAHVFLFRDFDESDWTLMTGNKLLGFEYTKVSQCPYCNEVL